MRSVRSRSRTILERSIRSRLLLVPLLLVLLAAGIPLAVTMADSAGVASGAIERTFTVTSPTPATDGDERPHAMRTVGGTALAAATADSWRSRAGSLLAAADSAWRELTRQERRILLDGAVVWADYDDLIAANPTIAELAFPIVYFAADLRPNDEIRTDDVDLNRVVLALPAAKLGPALAEGEKQAVFVGPDLIILVDDVVVSRIVGGASLDIDADRGTVDALGRIAIDDSRSGSRAEASSATIDPESTPPPRLAATGEVIERVPLAALPDEARETIALIQAGGPFPFERDGITFGNYEGNLPDAPFGYYREYTVITPGLDHRGARRIVAGDEGSELYYTDDHYQSFVEVVLPDD